MGAVLEVPTSLQIPALAVWGEPLNWFEKRGTVRRNVLNKGITRSWFRERSLKPTVPIGCLELHFRGEHLATGRIGLTYLAWNFFSTPSMLRLQIAITQDPAVFQDEGACAGVCALSLKQINLSGCSAALLLIFHFQHFKENNCRGQKYVALNPPPQPSSMPASSHQACARQCMHAKNERV